jgi:hypothetical protein
LSIAALIQAQISSNFNCNYTGMHISNWHPNYLIHNISNQFLIALCDRIFIHASFINLAAGFGEWSTNGCHVSSLTNGTAVVHCYHLSSFIVLEVGDLVQNLKIVKKEEYPS